MYTAYFKIIYMFWDIVKMLFLWTLLVQCLSEVKSSSLEASALASNFYFPFGKFIMFFLFSLLKKKSIFLPGMGGTHL